MALEPALDWEMVCGHVPQVSLAYKMTFVESWCLPELCREQRHLQRKKIATNRGLLSARPADRESAAKERSSARSTNLVRVHITQLNASTGQFSYCGRGRERAPRLDIREAKITEFQGGYIFLSKKYHFFQEWAERSHSMSITMITSGGSVTFNPEAALRAEISRLSSIVLARARGSIGGNFTCSSAPP